jgi:hypothetical protein
MERQSWESEGLGSSLGFANSFGDFGQIAYNLFER